MHKMTLHDLPDAVLHRRRVLVRVDFNVPLADGRVSDDTRIRATLPTLMYLLQREARVVLASHLGRPKGKWEPSLSLRPVVDRVAQLTGVPVHFIEDIAGAKAHGAADRLAPGEILLLENVRFVAGEEANDPVLAEGFAALADVFVNDAFGAAHRAHASTAGIAEIMKEEGRPAVAGLLMEKELEFLGRALEAPKRPFIAVLGGAKISGKIDVIENLLPRVDRLLIGGAMANTFFRALGLDTGRSLVEENRVDMARDLAQRAGDKLVLPVDVVVAEEARPGAATSVHGRAEVPAAGMILDIGPATLATFEQLLRDAGTVLWNGPVGMIEIEEFSRGSKGLARVLAEATDRGTISILGGGDTAAAAEAAALAQRMTHVSTGGGASLEFLEGRTLPGVAVLTEATNHAES